jgi:hypothetical protein
MSKILKAVIKYSLITLVVLFLTTIILAFLIAMCYETYF